jgi:phosphate-selective porin OprO and OprP
MGDRASSPVARRPATPRRCVARSNVVALALASVSLGVAAADGGPFDPNETPAASEQDLRWQVDWRGWDGLAMELVKPTQLELVRPPLLLDQVKLAATLGARIEIDAAAFGTNGTLHGYGDGVELRRARIRLAGDAVLAVPFRYKVEFGYNPGQFALEDFYIAIPELPWIGTLQFGQFRPTQGLQLLTSSWDIELMEPAAPLQALGPKSSPGVRLGRTVWNGRATWSVGAYGSGQSDGEYGSTLEDMTSAVARVTWLAIDGIDEKRAASNRYLHVGLSGTRQRASGGEVRYQSRPESYIAPYAVDTGTIASDKAYTLGAEVLWVDGAFSAQGELLQAVVQQTGGPRLSFGGAYVMASVALTGESRAYSRDNGTLARLRPMRNFEFGPGGGWGAIEAALRFSYTDLNDGAVAGGRLSLWMAGLDWTFRPQLQWMVNLGFGNVQGGSTAGRMAILQTRVGVYF